MSATKSIIRTKYEFDTFIKSEVILNEADSFSLEYERKLLQRNGAEIIDVTEDSFTMVDWQDSDITYKYELK